MPGHLRRAFGAWSPCRSTFAPVPAPAPRAIAWPMPREAPVTSATCLRACSSFQRLQRRLQRGAVGERERLHLAARCAWSCRRAPCPARTRRCASRPSRAIFWIVSTQRTGRGRLAHQRVPDRARARVSIATSTLLITGICGARQVDLGEIALQLLRRRAASATSGTARSPAAASRASRRSPCMLRWRARPPPSRRRSRPGRAR